MFPIKVLVVLSVCNLHFRIVCGVGFLGFFFGDHTVASWSWNLRAVSQAVPSHKKTTGDLREPLWAGLGVANCPILVWMLEGELLLCTGWFLLWCLCCWKEALAETWWPCSCGADRGQDPLGRVSCSLQLPSSHKSPCPEVQLMSVSHQILSLWVFHVWTLLMALLNTALRLSGPRVALRVGYFKLISRLLPYKESLKHLFCLIFHH